MLTWAPPVAEPACIPPAAVHTPRRLTPPPLLLLLLPICIPPTALGRVVGVVRRGGWIVPRGRRETRAAPITRVCVFITPASSAAIGRVSASAPTAAAAATLAAAPLVPASAAAVAAAFPASTHAAVTSVAL